MFFNFFFSGITPEQFGEVVDMFDNHVIALPTVKEVQLCNRTVSQHIAQDVQLLCQ